MMIDPTVLDSIPNEAVVAHRGHVRRHDQRGGEGPSGSPASFEGESARLFYSAYMDLHVLWRFRGSGMGCHGALTSRVAGVGPATARRLPIHGDRGRRSSRGTWHHARDQRAVLLVVYLVQHALFGDRLPPGAVAKVTGAVDCYWAEAPSPWLCATRLLLARQIDLEEGLVEITHRSGAA